ncbi:hypothetical protein GCM10008941_16090 [Rhizomicrobium palustre]
MPTDSATPVMRWVIEVTMVIGQRKMVVKGDSGRAASFGAALGVSAMKVLKLPDVKVPGVILGC